jgi:hypothetical protein
VPTESRTKRPVVIAEFCLLASGSGANQAQPARNQGCESAYQREPTAIPGAAGSTEAANAAENVESRLRVTFGWKPNTARRAYGVCRKPSFLLVAGAGFEPATFGL